MPAAAVAVVAAVALAVVAVGMVAERSDVVAGTTRFGLEVVGTAVGSRDSLDNLEEAWVHRIDAVVVVADRYWSLVVEHDRKGSSEVAHHNLAAEAGSACAVEATDPGMDHDADAGSMESTGVVEACALGLVDSQVGRSRMVVDEHTAVADEAHACNQGRSLDLVLQLG